MCGCNWPWFWMKLFVYFHQFEIKTKKQQWTRNWGTYTSQKDWTYIFQSLPFTMILSCGEQMPMNLNQKDLLMVLLRQAKTICFYAFFIWATILCGTRICFGGSKISVSFGTSTISLPSPTKLSPCTTWQVDGETQVWSANDIGMLVIIGTLIYY